MPSIVIPAHDEEAVIGRCLDALFGSAEADEFEVVVVPNGCSDRTESIVSGYGRGVCCVPLRQASKAAALNHGDRLATRFPRIFVDADVVLTTASVRSLAETLCEGSALVAAPRLRVDLGDRSRLICRYYEVWTRLPYIADGVIGSGVYGLAEEGRRRFSDFPEIIADDLFIRNLFMPHERATAPGEFLIHPPRTLRSLVRIRVRQLAANYQYHEQFGGSSATSVPRQRVQLLLLAARPRRWIGLATYLGVNAAARAQLRRVRRKPLMWNADRTTRTL